MGWKPLPWLGSSPANCTHQSSFPAAGTPPIRSNGAKLRTAEPRAGGTREKPGGLAMVGVFSCKSKAGSSDPTTAPYELRTRTIWVRATPHRCAARSSSKNLRNHEGRATGLCGAPTPRAKKLLSNTVLSSAQLPQRRKGFKCLNCVFKNVHCFLPLTIVGSYKGLIVTHWGAKCINHTSPHTSKESNHKQKHVPFYNW